MTRASKTLLLVGGLLFVAVIGTAIRYNLNDHSDPLSSDGHRTPLGNLFHKAAAVSDLKQKMGNLRDAHAAFRKYAESHQDELPKNIADLRPFLPQKLAYLDDQHWDLPSSGKLNPLMTGSDANKAILLREKVSFPDNPAITLYADGHIEYRK